MALFGKKKSEASAPPSTPASASTAPTVDNAFDFDAISRDLDAQNGASSFDALLSQPAQPGATPVNAAPTPTPAATESVFDIPASDDPFQMTPPPAPVRAQVHTIPIVPETVPVAPQTTTITHEVEPDFHAAASLVPAPTSVASEPLSPAPVVVEATTPTPVQVPTGRVRPVLKPKKSLPLVPLLGGLGLLAILGGGAMFLRNSQQEPLDTPAPPPRPRVAKALAPAPAPPQTPRIAAAPRAPVAPLAPATAPRSASPGVAPPAVSTQVATAPRPNAASSPIRIARDPAPPRANGGIFGAPAKGPTATAGLDIGLASRLKALWQAGADAKHRHNYKEARDSWQEALRLRPGHPGFAEAIAKLPK